MRGVDISHHNGVIDWTKVPSDIEFTILKCSEGTTYNDPTFQKNKTEVRKKGLALGFYHFANGTDPIKEADFFVKSVGDMQTGEFLVLDWETSNSNPVNWCLSFLNRVYELTDIKPLLYTNESRVKQYDWTEVVKGDYGLWEAKYGANNGQMGTDPNIGKWPFLSIWQYTSKGRLTGISGFVDLNEAYMSKETLMKYGKKSASIPNPTPATKGKVISRKQGDPRWGSVKIGQSSSTLAGYGCLITVISDALYWMGIDRLPDDLAKNLSFTPDGLLYWNSITEKTRAKFVYRYYSYNIGVIENALKHPTQCVFIEFYFAGARHWCWALSKDIFGRYRIADPLQGNFGVASRYGTPIGFAIIDLK